MFQFSRSHTPQLHVIWGWAFFFDVAHSAEIFNDNQVLSRSIRNSNWKFYKTIVLLCSHTFIRLARARFIDSTLSAAVNFCKFKNAHCSWWKWKFYCRDWNLHEIRGDELIDSFVDQLLSLLTIWRRFGAEHDWNADELGRNSKKSFSFDWNFEIASALSPIMLVGNYARKV